MKYVYHGSEHEHSSSTPRRNRRLTEGVVMFDSVSFHATPHKWIAVAYTYKPKKITINDKEYYYNMGVNLKEYSENIYIYGITSLEYSLKQLYGDGGYITTFKAKDFYWREGLGSEEVIIEREIDAERVEFIQDPVSFLRAEGIEFHFRDISKELPRFMK